MLPGVLVSDVAFSHGFRLFVFTGCVPWPSRIVLGISLMPGMGFPVVISSTMCAKEVG